MVTENKSIKLHFDIPDSDFSIAGEASSSVKKKMSQLGIAPGIIKKAAVSMYEAEMNAVIHANGGVADIEIDDNKVFIRIRDEGPGIQNVNLAMQEGYSTASDNVRQLGFGAGMGLPNIKRYADKLNIISNVGKGTTLEITINIP
ncbi:MAG: ATP-binding protein [Clostridia bacterium]|jgi:anti-sigma regulatory factor (Ser/Thr protein kinase)